MMVEPPDPPSLMTHAAGMDRRARTRPRRSALPAQDDERVPRVVEGSPSEPSPRAHPDRGRKKRPSSDPLATLIPRLDWVATLEREEHRRARYDRPVGVAVVDLPNRRDQRLIRHVAGILRQESRDTDHITRVGPGRFHILLPETRERGVRNYVDRVYAAWSAAEREIGTEVVLGIGGAGTRSGESIPAALERAIAQLR